MQPTEFRMFAPARHAGTKNPRSIAASRVQGISGNRTEYNLVPGIGLEPASREAADFKSAMFTNFITPAGVRTTLDANSTIARRAHQTGAIQPRPIPTLARQA
jgi:hypothetical protein